MGYCTPERPDNFCCAPDCLDNVLELAPVPLCPTHVRETYEFGVALVDTWKSLETAQQRAEYIEQRYATSGPDFERQQQRAYAYGRGYVYFIRFSERIKIGWSRAPHKRIANLPFDEVLAVVPGTIQQERRYHERFAHLRTTGEWFRAEPELIDFIDDLRDAAA